MGGASDSNITIESNQSVGEIKMCDLVILEYLVHYSTLCLVKKIKYQLNKITRHITV